MSDELIAPPVTTIYPSSSKHRQSYNITQYQHSIIQNDMLKLIQHNKLNSCNNTTTMYTHNQYCVHNNNNKIVIDNQTCKSLLIQYGVTDTPYITDEIDYLYRPVDQLKHLNEYHYSSNNSIKHEPSHNPTNNSSIDTSQPFSHDTYTPNRTQSDVTPNKYKHSNQQQNNNNILFTLRRHGMDHNNYNNNKSDDNNKQSSRVTLPQIINPAQYGLLNDSDCNNNTTTPERKYNTNKRNSLSVMNNNITPDRLYSPDKRVANQNTINQTTQPYSNDDANSNNNSKSNMDTTTNNNISMDDSIDQQIDNINVQQHNHLFNLLQAADLHLSPH